jgi:ABC-2 type transport system ATP-binding protein
MYARLGFSIAIHTDPELLLTDEVLSVGDEPFQKKCLSKIKEMQDEGRSIILVTHSAQTVRDFCDSAVLLSHGELLAQGDVESVLKKYEALP